MTIMHCQIQYINPKDEQVVMEKPKLECIQSPT